jgi:hypothetical protein
LQSRHGYTLDWPIRHDSTTMPASAANFGPQSRAELKRLLIERYDEVERLMDCNTQLDGRLHTLQRAWDAQKAEIWRLRDELERIRRDPGL